MKKLLTYLIGSSALMSSASAMPIDDSSDAWKVTGLIDVYYGTSLTNQVRGFTRSARQFDVRNEQGRLAAAQLNITYTNPTGRFGATLSPWLGDNANLLYLTEPSQSQIAKHLAQAYVTFADPESQLTVDLGKFYSWIGYEGAESLGNDLYSRGFLYTVAQPVYHLGFRVSKQLNDQWGASAFLTNGWNQVERGHNGVTGGLQVRYAAGPKTSASIGVISGREGGNRANRAGSFGGIGYGSAGPASTTLTDIIVTHQATDKLKLAVNADYATARGGGKSGTWSGVALSARYQHDEKLGVGMRLETVRDDGGLRLGQRASASSMALGLDYWADTDVLLRAEFRRDWSNSALFGSNIGPRRTQGTLTLSIGVRF